MNRIYTFNDIHNYLFDELSPTEKELFEAKLQQDETLRAEVAAYKNLQGLAVQVFTDELLQEVVLNIDNQRKIEAGERTYTLEELLAMFEPSPAYEVEIVRSGATHVQQTLGIIAPQHEEEVSQQVVIKLDKPLEFELKVIIKNNQEREVYRGVVPSQTVQYAIDMAALNCPPGRYYFTALPKNRRLARKYETALRVLYIRKDLMPNFFLKK